MPETVHLSLLFSLPGIPGGFLTELRKARTSRLHGHRDWHFEVPVNGLAYVVDEYEDAEDEQKDGSTAQVPVVHGGAGTWSLGLHKISSKLMTHAP